MGADLSLLLDEKNAAKINEEIQAELCQKELSLLEEQEKNSEMPPLTAYYCRQELDIMATSVARLKDSQDELLEASKKRRAEWLREKTKLQEELHQAGISIEVAKGDLEVTQLIPRELRKS